MSKPETAGDRIYHEIRSLIVSGEIKPGDRLVQRQLAGQFGTSNIPVVEAIRRLERDGLVVNHPNWGAQVRKWTRDDVISASVVREAVESYACRLFIERATESQKVALKEHACAFDDHARAKNKAGCVDADIEFHMFIVKCTGISMLCHVAENTGIIAACIANDEESMISAHDAYGPIGIHDKLVFALTHGDVQAAEAACKAHIYDALYRNAN